ncbi:alpha/beta hydrolase [Williamsia sp. 1138]|uniref:alpha/beta fold hydrolase n=1 Tax=Williamsia sp. 1138 TaxID=1903117 RepID=UPI000A0F4105|nr:alpha/beta hydrolase [Williamsia sp. 1138]OZG27944.1 alpha/beta hydrolase [Williamsia sp. 1138]
MPRDESNSTVTVGGLGFDVRSRPGGEGDPVILLHGFPETSASWSTVADLLATAGIASYAPDQRGYSPGARPTDIADYRLQELVGDIVGLCDEFGLERVHLAGHDWGAIVAWAVAAAHPERVTTLTAVSVPHPAAFAWARENDPDQRERSGYMEFFAKPDEPEQALLADDCVALRLGFGDVVPADAVAEHLRVLTAPGAMTAALNWYRAMDPADQEIADVTVPTTFIWSSGDIAIRRAGVERCGQHVSGPYRYIEIPDGSHWVPEEFPSVVADAITVQIEAYPSGAPLPPR